MPFPPVRVFPLHDVAVSEDVVDERAACSDDYLAKPDRESVVVDVNVVCCNADQKSAIIGP